jgi:DNA repair exonuclease SbcCD nuclease subunit
MIKTIVHIADIHYRNFQRHIEYRAICENFIYQMRKIKPDRIVIAGDVVHSRNQISPELVNEVSWFLNECSNVTEKVIIIPGNHDIVEQNKERMDALTPIINMLNVDNNVNNIHYYTKSSVNFDDNVAWVVYSIYDNNMAPEAIMVNNYLDKIKIGLYHGILNGATNNQGFKFMHGSDVEKFAICDVVLCGDIHKRQVLYTKNGTALIMPGSFIQQDFSETISEHGFNTLTLDQNKVLSYNFTDIENPIKYLNFKITDIQDIENGNEELMNA